MISTLLRASYLPSLIGWWAPHSRCGNRIGWTGAHGRRSALVATAALAIFAVALVAPLHAAGAIQEVESPDVDARLQGLRVEAESLRTLMHRLVEEDEDPGEEARRALEGIFRDLERLESAREEGGERQRGDGDIEALGAELESLADRIARLRLQIRNPRPETVIPSGTNIVLRTRSWISSRSARVGDRFELELAEDVTYGGELLIPQGTVFEGRVAEVDSAAHGNRSGKLRLVVDRLRGDDDRNVEMDGEVVSAGPGGELEGDNADFWETVRRGLVGAAAGRLVGGRTGAVVGLAVGAGGSLIAGKGEEVDLPAGTQLWVRIQERVSVDWSWRPIER